jgi:hypothetical protein
VAGTTSPAQTITLSNPGTGALNITGVTITGSGSADFTELNTCGASLAASATCMISVTFAPTQSGNFSANVSVADNVNGSPQTVALTGTATAAPTFTVSPAPATQTIQSGATAMYTITVAAQNGTFAGAVNLAASGLPTGATALFSPTSVSPGSSSATSTLTITTASASAAGASRGALPLGAIVLSLFGLMFVPVKARRQWIAVIVLAIAGVTAAASLTGCSGGGAPKTTGQTYTITVTGTSGTQQRSTTVQLVVE